MPSIALFDVDGTLLKGYSGFFATLILIEKGILKKRRLPLALFYRIISPFYKGNVRKMYEIAAIDMAGVSLEKILEIGQECFDRWLKQRIYEEGVRIIQEHRQRGEPVYFITSGPTMVIKILSDFLGADGFYSAGPIVDEAGYLTSRIHLPVTYREGKLPAAEEILKKHRAVWSDCYFYTDSADDLPLLEKVGHPRLVNPDRILQRMSERRGWPRLQFQKVLGIDV